MRPVVSLFVVLLAALTATAALASEPSVRQLLGKYNTIRPDDDQLAMYRLDWIELLADAQDLALSRTGPYAWW